MVFFKAIFSLLVFISICRSEIQVHINQISDDAKFLAVGVAEEGFLNKHSDDVIAQRLSDDFNKYFGAKWTCVVGSKGIIETIMPVINTSPNTLLWFSYNTSHVLLFKVQQKITTYLDVINNPINLTITFLKTTFDNTTSDFIHSTIIESIRNNIGNCSINVSHNQFYETNCYHQMTEEIINKLFYKYGHNWTMMSGVLNYGSVSAFYADANWNHYLIVFGNVLDFTIWVKY